MRGNRSAATRCSPRARWAWCAGSARTGTRQRSAGSPPSSPNVADARPRRLAALAEGLTAAHVDGLLVTSLPSIRYLTGFSGSSALLLVTQRDAILVTDFRYQTQAAEEAGDVARVSIEAQSLWTGLWQQMAQSSGLQVVGFEAAHLLYRDF